MPLAKNASFLVASLFFLVSGINDGLQRTLTWPTLIFGACVAMMVARTRWQRRAGAPATAVKAKALPAGVGCTAEELTYVDEGGRTHQLHWDDIQKVTWSEPDYGYLGGEPYWTVYGKHSGFDIEGAWEHAEGDLLPQWLARSLPGFDAAVVGKARARGYFKTQSPETLLCWARAGEQTKHEDS